MFSLKKIAVCLAVTALLAVAASPASAERLPEGGGQPALSGEMEKQGVIHCQVFIELFTGQEFSPGTFSGNIVVTPDGTFRYAGPKQAEKLCPLKEIFVP